MRKSWIPCLAVGLALVGPSPSRSADSVTDTLRRQTQELLDAITAGDASVWERYLDDGVRYTAEDGTVLDKRQLLAQTQPLAAGVSGEIRIVELTLTEHGDVAIVNHVDDEHETYHGHRLHCQYRNTDTWMKGAGGWRLIAAQVLALRSDPPAIALAAERLRDYVGRYELAPEITYEIRLENGELVGQRSGRAAEKLLVEAPDDLFTPGQVRYRKIFARDPAGKVTGFVERREAWDLPWKRLP